MRQAVSLLLAHIHLYQDPQPYDPLRLAVLRRRCLQPFKPHWMGEGAAMSVLAINCELHTFTLGGGSSVLGKIDMGEMTRVTCTGGAGEVLG